MKAKALIPIPTSVRPSAVVTFKDGCAQIWEPLSLSQIVIQFWIYFEKIPKQFEKILADKSILMTVPMSMAPLKSEVITPGLGGP